MTESLSNDAPQDLNEKRHRSRMGLVWAVLVFQTKLIVDGLRDLVLVPFSLAAALLGLVFAGDEPDRYFRKVLLLGRRSEVWINLFGHRKSDRTADALFEPIRQKVVEESQQRPWMQKAEKGLNKTLDKVNERVESAVSQREHRD